MTDDETKPDPQELPTEQDFAPNGYGPDARRAWEKLGGLTLDEVGAVLRETPTYAQFHFYWMGPKAFAYYFPVIESYVKDPTGYRQTKFDRDCDSLAFCIQGQFKGEVDEVVHLAPRVLELADFVQAHLNRFSSDAKERRHLDGQWRDLKYAVISVLANREHAKFRPKQYDTPHFQARLHVLLARDAPMGVVIRRGPPSYTAILGWNRETDEFTLGQWFKGRIYERRSDLSPDGKYMIYFAMNDRLRTESRGSWTAISRAPYLKAIALLAKGDTWNGGGLWTSDRTYWLNDGHGHDLLRDTDEVARDTSFKPAVSFGTECQAVHFAQLVRDGWNLVEKPSNALQDSNAIFEKPLMHGWILRKIAHAGDAPPGKGFDWDEHALVHPATNRTIAFPDWEWAERDRDRLVWATAGRLYAAQLDDCGPKPETMLYDFNEMEFEPIEAPY